MTEVPPPPPDVRFVCISHEKTNTVLFLMHTAPVLMLSDLRKVVSYESLKGVRQRYVVGLVGLLR